MYNLNLRKLTRNMKHEIFRDIFEKKSHIHIKILIFTKLHFLKKIKKNTWRYHYFTPVYQKS